VIYQVRFAPAAAEDLQRLFDVLAEQDLGAAERAREVIGQAIVVLQTFPFTCRKASPENPFQRELVISFGSHGYVGLSEVAHTQKVTVLAVRHQREDDYY
jgi:plasmid stabilization system protein ParE